METNAAIQSSVEDLPAGGRLTLTHHSDYLHALVRGPVDSLALDQDYFARIAAASRGIRRVLIEEDLGTQLSIAEIFWLGCEAATLAANGTRIAFVDRHDSHRPGNEFGARVAHNRGANVRVCADVNEALAWLRVGEPGD